MGGGEGVGPPSPAFVPVKNVTFLPSGESWVEDALLETDRSLPDTASQHHEDGVLFQLQDGLSQFMAASSGSLLLLEVHLVRPLPPATPVQSSEAKSRETRKCLR